MPRSLPRIVFLNRCYWPDNEATGQLLTDLCEDLSGSFDVHVICGQPNSPSAGAKFTKLGRQVRDQVTIHRLSHTKFSKRIPAGRLLNIMSFARAASRYLKRTRLNADVLVSETDPFLLPVVGAQHALTNNAKHICYLQDIYPDVAEAIGKAKAGWLTNRVRGRLRTAYEQADRIVVLGDCMSHRLASMPWEIEANKITVIPNWADCDLIHPRPKTELRGFLEANDLHDRFVVMHSGNMGLTQRLNVLVDAAADPAWPDNAVLTLVGDGAARQDLQRQAGSLAGDRIRFLPYQPRSELSNSLSSADLHIVSMHDNIAGCLCPSKLYGILAAGRPVLAIGPTTTDLHHVVREQKIGWCCPPGDSAAIAAAVASAASDDQGRSAMSQRARDLAVDTYDRKVVTTTFANMLGELTTPIDSNRASVSANA